MKDGKHWPWIVVGLLVLNAVGVLVLVLVATGDPSHHVEEDYYRKALAWDAHMAQERHNRELGWRADVAVSASARWGERVVEIQLRDRDGHPLDGAELELQTFHNARSGNILRARLKPAGQGRYRASLPMRRAGIWELRLVVKRRAERFTQTIQHELGPLDSTTAGRAQAAIGGVPETQEAP